ncbi:hypothetical protein COU60_01780 [Candidatus Pacearchaeota archaeon CG10_big_fil_rev_8_21_14_0_10_34_76]|nr:MAG: hypothetical protein COU60_01780 [Candidatus Pacearchaeota archaeon CG10_big_fil_rev_8_21_14_0_10_34_76]
MTVTVVFVTVNKMNIDEVEEKYRSDIEKANADFLNNLNNKVNDPEKIYKKKLKKSREEYYSQTSKYIEKLKKYKNNKKSFKKEKPKHFQLDDRPIELTKLEKFRFSASLHIFRFKIFAKKKFSKLYYPHIAYLVKFSKLKTKMFLNDLSKIIAIIKRNIWKNVSSIASYIFGFTKKIRFRKNSKKQNNSKETKTTNESPNESTSSDQARSK